MGFLWSEIGFEFSTISFRYYSEMIWYMYSVAGFLPLLLLTIYKCFINPVDLQTLAKDPKLIKRRWDDYAIVPFIFYGPIYYFIDLTISIYERSFIQQCRFTLWYHHIISVVVLTRLLDKRIFFWWEAALPALHAVLVYGAHDIITYSYVALVVYFNYKCYVFPYNQLPQFRFIGKFFPYMYYAFFLTAFYGCSNPMPYLS